MSRMDKRYKVLLRWLPNDLRPSLSREYRHFKKLGRGSLLDDEIDVEEWHGIPVGSLLVSAFIFSESLFGFDYWMRACRRLGISKKKQKESANATS